MTTEAATVEAAMAVEREVGLAEDSVVVKVAEKEAEQEEVAEVEGSGAEQEGASEGRTVAGC